MVSYRKALFAAACVSAAVASAAYAAPGNGNGGGNGNGNGGGNSGNGGSVAAPGPIVGAGLPFLLVAGAAGVYGLIRRRQNGKLSSDGRIGHG